MLSNNNRQFFTKYYFGNAIFWVLCATFGFVSYSFLSFSFQFFYELFDKNASYHLFSSGVVFLIIGLTFIVLKKIKPTLGFRSMVWTMFFTLLLMYWGSFVANAYPRIALYIFVPTYFLIGFLFLLFVVAWKRSGGVPMIVSFLFGIASSGTFSYLYGVDFSFLAISVRASALLFLAFSIVYLSGCFGIFKKRLFYVGILSSILVLGVMYPLDTDTTVEEFKRFKWEKNKTVVGADYEYIGSYKTMSRNIDVFMKGSSDKEEMKFVENGTISPYTYPIQDKYRFGFYILLMQHRSPKNILSVGDIPSGLVNIFDNFSRFDRIDYLPVDPLYPELWANFIHDDMFQRVSIQNSYSELRGRYDLVLIFPPYIKGVGAAPYIGKGQFKKIKRLMDPSGTCVVVTPSDLGVVNKVSKDMLEKTFKYVETIDLVSGLLFTEGSNELSNISSEPATLKYRLLESGIKKDYADVRAVLDSGGFFQKKEASQIVIKEPVKIGALFKYLFLSTLAFTVILSFLYLNFTGSRRYISYISGIFMFAVMSADFCIYALNHQRMFVDLNVYFPLILSVFLFCCGIGMLLGLWGRVRINMFVIFFSGAMLLLVPIVYKNFFADFHIGRNDALVMSAIIGISSLLIFGSRYWNEMSVSISHMVRLLGVALVGFAIGFICMAMLDYNMTDTVRTDRYFLFSSLCVSVMFVVQVRMRGDSK